MTAVDILEDAREALVIHGRHQERVVGELDRVIAFAQGEAWKEELGEEDGRYGDLLASISELAEQAGDIAERARKLRELAEGMR